MQQPRFLFYNRSFSGSVLCFLSPCRTFYGSTRLLAANVQQPVPRKDEEFNPQPLNRPIGLTSPPKAGQNTGVDSRRWRQRRDDFLNYGKHMERREEL